MPLAVAMIVAPLALYVLAYSGLRLTGVVGVTSSNGVACSYFGGCTPFTTVTIELRPGSPGWIERVFSPAADAECALFH